MSKGIGWSVALSRPREPLQVGSTRTLVMGVINVTPDSFHAGSRADSPGEAARRAEVMLGEGATLLDVGGESTRPGARPLDAIEEARRVEVSVR